MEGFRSKKKKRKENWEPKRWYAGGCGEYPWIIPIMVVLIFLKISYENWCLGFYRIWFLRVNGVKIMSGCGWNLKKKKKKMRKILESHH